MPKHLLEDMVKIKKNKRENIKVNNLPKEKEVGRERVGREKITEMGSGKSGHRHLLWFVALASIVFCVFAFSFLFERAEVTVNPKTQDFVLSENMSASKEPGANDLFFDLIVIEGEESITVPVTGEKDVAEKATGTVILYNTFSTSPQNLNIDTRLEGSNGKIYKTLTKTTVPGMVKGGKPGSVEVKIYGDKAGEEYNSAPLDFKILGFKGTSKYEKFYGRSKGAIAGGFKGKAPDISGAERANAFSSLKDSLRSKLVQKSINQIPDGFILFKDATFLDTKDSNISSTYDKESNNMVFKLKGTLHGILFSEQKLTKKIATSKVEKYDGGEVYIPHIRDLVFSLSSNEDSLSFDGLKNINFKLSGSTKIVWKLDVDKFTNDLFGKKKKDFNQILSQYPNIESATLKLNLPWKTSVPEKKKDIKVIVNYGE